MRGCPECRRLYPEPAAFCHVDGRSLVDAGDLAIPPEPDDARVGGVLFERYRIFRVVRDGGTGRVYEALDLVLQRQVALKVLHEDVARDEVAVERFAREFELSQRLKHAHIVEVFDFRPTPEGSHVLIMEFLRGEELRSLLQRETTVSPARVVRMLSQVALAMDTAHQRACVHRDLKPDNLFLNQTPLGDEMKILDFGSAKDHRSEVKPLTMLGATLGSTLYMSPEQARGLPVDPRTDVWALGVIAYECLTGRLPFAGVNAPSTLLAIVGGAAVPASSFAELRYPVPRAVDRVLEAAFSKDPTKRTASAGALADGLGRAYGLSGSHADWATRDESALERELSVELQALSNGSGEAAAPVRTSRWRVAWWGLTLGLLLGGVLGLVLR